MSTNRTGCTAEELLAALASDSFVELRNQGDRWVITYRQGHGESLEKILLIAERNAIFGSDGHKWTDEDQVARK